MEQITREEMIELIDKASGLLCFYGEDKLSLELDEAIAALQAAEPAGYGLKGLFTKQWDGKTFVEKEDADSYEEAALLPLFALPCPPAKALVPEEQEEPSTDDEWDKGYWVGWNDCRAEMLESFTASPAPDRNADADKRQQEEAER